MPRPLGPLLAAAVLALGGAGCGGEQNAGERIDVPRDQPAVVAPGTDIPYEAGGADGSGADGSEAPDSRGGVAAGPDTTEPNEQREGGDPTQSPPREPFDPGADR